LAKEAIMSTLNASWNFLSGLAVQFGAEPMRCVDKTKSPMFAKGRGKKKRQIRRLDKKERQELVESIRHDDWFE
jgi:hypothetical protein